MSKTDIRYLQGSIAIPPDEVIRLSKMTPNEFMKEYLDKKRKQMDAIKNEAIRLYFEDDTGKLGEEKDE